MHNILLTGVPGIGKTTVIMKVVHLVQDLRLAGFYTEEIREKTIRKGFHLVTLQGRRSIMAHVKINSVNRVGKYGVDVNTIDSVMDEALPLNGSADMYIVDEIGRMECFSETFRQRISVLLESEKPVIATIAVKGNGFVAEVKKRHGITLWEITRKNRNAMPAKISAWIRDMKM